MGVTQKIMKLVALLEPGFWATTKSNGNESIVYPILVELHFGFWVFGDLHDFFLA